MDVQRIWDRQSIRHNWRIYATSDNPERIDALVKNRLAALAKDPKWHNVQIGITHQSLESATGLQTKDDCNRPKNAPMDRIITVKDHI
jgi:hypothetical protein